MIIATQDSVTVKDFITLTFKEAGYDNIEWVGQGTDEKLFDRTNDKILVEIDP